VSDNPTLLEGSGVVQLSKPSPAAGTAETDAGVQLGSLRARKKQRSRGLIALVGVLCAVGLSAFALARRPARAPVAQATPRTATAPAAPTEKPPQETAPASKPLTTIATPSAVLSAEPAVEPTPARSAARAAPSPRKVARAARAPSPAPSQEQRARALPAPGLDIELSR
jgi:hypothetical protein